VEGLDFPPARKRNDHLTSSNYPCSAKFGTETVRDLVREPPLFEDGAAQMPD